MKDPVGFKFEHPKHGKLTVTEHIPTEHGGVSTFMRCSGDAIEPVVLHENIVFAAMRGESIAEPVVVRVKKEGGTKLDKAKKFIEQLARDSSLSNTQRIKQLADKLRISRASASSYFYKVRGGEKE